jgi:anthranilate synthase component I
MKKKIIINTKLSRGLSDIFTPVGIYLRLRDRFRDTILLESTDHHSAENSYSFIAVNAIGGIEIREDRTVEIRLPAVGTETRKMATDENLEEVLEGFMQSFEIEENDEPEKFSQGLYGYLSYDSIPLIESLSFSKRENNSNEIPIARYRLYQYVIAIHHYKDELVLLENVIEGIDTEIELVRSLIRGKDVPVYPFHAQSMETSNMDDDYFMEMVKKGIRSCKRGDVFQVVVSRRFQQEFKGDDFNVYRALRNVNPSPYLFYFDYGEYKLMGSSPEAQLVIKDGKAILHPIAGTFKRTGSETEDLLQAEALLNDPKENAEHVMLVDLARNDLSRVCDSVKVDAFRQIQFYSHVIHLVSEVSGKVNEDVNPFHVLFQTFPAGTLSGAPKYKAMQLIDENEPTARSYYGGAIGFVGFNGSVNHAIMIRSFLCKDNQLFYQAGAGVVVNSSAEMELKEVNNKLGALKKAILMASGLQEIK